MTALALQNVQNAIIDLMPDLRRFARSLTGSTDAGNELVQTAYERALSRPDALATVDQPASWMCRIIRNIWIDGKRSSRERLSAPLEDAEHRGQRIPSVPLSLAPLWRGCVPKWPPYLKIYVPPSCWSASRA
jgi:RNA polymerase sigma-70 factor, ECF subfamily